MIEYQKNIFKTREDYMMNHLSDNIVGAELGVFQGDFSRILYDTGKFSKLFLVDIFTGMMDSGDKNGKNIQKLNLDNEYTRLLEVYNTSDIVHVIKNRTDDFLKSVNDNFLDFVYIDADHSYNVVKSDLSLSRQKVKSGGIIAGHDYNREFFPGVFQAVNEFITQYDLQIETTIDDQLASYFIKNTK